MAIQTLKHATELGVKLHVQQVFERFVEFKTKGLIQDVTPHALFMPLVVRSGDAVTERFLFTPYDDERKRGQVRSWLLTRQRPAKIDDPRCRRIHPCVPHADRRVRHFGFLANRAKKQSLFRCRQLLGLNAALPEIPDRSTEDLLLELTGVDLSRCPACKKGTMVIVAELPKLRSWDSS